MNRKVRTVKCYSDVRRSEGQVLPFALNAQNKTDPRVR